MDAFDDESLFKMVNDHSDEVKAKRMSDSFDFNTEQTSIDYGKKVGSYNKKFFDDIVEASDMQFFKEEISASVKDSVNKAPIRYGQKKSLLKKKIVKALAVILTIASLSSAMTAIVTNDIINDNNLVIAYDDETINEVDENIEYYKSIVRGEQIKIFQGYDHSQDRVDYYYSTMALSNLLYRVSNKENPELELRCAVLAAYSETRDTSVLDESFKLLNLRYADELDSNIMSLTDKGFIGFLEQLNYGDNAKVKSTDTEEEKIEKLIKEYRLNEKNEIVKLRTISNLVDNGKGL